MSKLTRRDKIILWCYSIGGLGSLFVLAYALASAARAAA
jgi:hypothetical protein